MTPGLAAFGRPGAAFALFLVANLGLTGLQLLWTSKILRAVGGGEGAQQKKKR